VRLDGDEGDVVVGVVGEHAGGELVTFPASVNRTSRTSMEIGVRMATQDLVSQVVRHTNSGYFTVVAVGPVGDRLRSRRGSRPPPKNAVGTGPLVGVGSSSRKSSVPPRGSGRRRPPDHNAAGTCPPWSGGVV
jgi:hypothetical protein